MQITIETTTNVATLAAAVTMKAGGQAPVAVIFQTSGAPATLGGTPAIEMALSAQSTSPSVLAYLDDFTAEAGSTFVGRLDGTDSRLMTYMSGVAAANLNMELAWTLAGHRYISPNLTVTVQQEIMSGPQTSGGGPTYVTTGALGADIAGLSFIPVGTAARLAPVNNGFKVQVSPDGGITWQDGASFTV